MRLQFTTLAAIAIAAMSSPAAAQGLKADTQGTINFPTLRFETTPGALGGTPGTAETGRAILRLPKSDGQKAPLVVLVHTIGGYLDQNEGWFARELNKVGFATAEIDSFGPRNARDVWKTGGSWPNATMSSDALNLLKSLQSHPGIDTARAAVVGFSLGGEVAHLTAFKALADKVAPDGPRFAAHVPFYPPCAVTVSPAGPGYTGAPILMVLAEKDDEGPPARCRALAEIYKAKDRPAPLDFIVYPGAYHAFTNPTVGRPHFEAAAASTATCATSVLGPGGGEIRDGAIKPFDAAARAECVKHKGYSMGYDAKIRDQSLADLIAFLNKTLRG